MKSSHPLTGPLSFLLTLMMLFHSFMSCSSISFISLHCLNSFRSVPSLRGSHVHYCTRFRITIISLHKLSHNTLLISGLHIARFVMKFLLLSNDPRQVTFSLCLSSPHQFWSYVRSLSSTSASIHALSSPNSPPILSDPDKASLINSTFSSLFTTDPSPLVNPSPLDPSLCPDDLLCSEEEVDQLISDLPSNTSCCLDGISSFLLKSTALSISLPLQKNYCSHSKYFPSLIFPF